uniref:Kinesin motor domain-containing protein n=1 Tax=Oreochromis aureus TaxID=47969 RepID=A0AAZ1Y190_OREAU
MTSVRVAVRVRPLNKREKQLSSKVIIHMKEKTTTIQKPTVRGDELKGVGKTFSYDFSYDSSDRRSPTFASQEKIFRDLGFEVLKAAFEGCNACVIAYGQTGSGKSYTMMGPSHDKGLIPRICEGLFWEISHRSKSDAVTFHTEVSYLEICNERVQDLLKKRASPADDGGLSVREHPRHGPYVENLSKHVVQSYSEVEGLIILGNANRTTASRGVNDFSRRSHAIFTIMFTQVWFDAEPLYETVSKIHLVDLAGSEKVDPTRTVGGRLKESADINKSLVTLGHVISALADLGVGVSTTKPIFIPYRDSVLTWLLKDSLGGNSKTTMIATVSPADVNYMETLNTLRFASRAKNIVNSPIVNDNGSVKVMRELQAEVTKLNQLLKEPSQVGREVPLSSVDVKEELNETKSLQVVALTKNRSSTWRETLNILQEETVTLRKEGSGVVLDCCLPHLIGVGEDLQSTGIALYYLKEGRTIIGSGKASCTQDIVLHGPGLLSVHCVLENIAGTVTLFPQDGALCLVNGSVVTDPCQLTQGAIIQLGKGATLWFNQPTASQLRLKYQSGLPSVFSPSVTDSSNSTENLSKAMVQNRGQHIHLAKNAEVMSKASSVCLAPTPAKKFGTTDTGLPRRRFISHSSFESDGETLQNGVSARDGQERERDLCHKSGPGLRSERKAQSGTGVASCKGEEGWSGDANLQQTSVLGLGDGCGTKPEGNANEIQDDGTDCYKGRPHSGGSSLSGMSHLQSSRGTSSMSILPQSNTHSQLDTKPLDSHTGFCPPKETTITKECSCGEMAESENLEKIPGVCVTEAAAAAVQNLKLSSLFSRVSWIVQDAGRLLWSSSTVLQQVTEFRFQPVGARWSNNFISLDSHIFSMVKELPLIQHVQMDIIQLLQSEEAAQMIQVCINPENAQLPVPTPTQTLSKAEELPIDVQLVSGDILKRNESMWDMESTRNMVDGNVKQRDELITKHLPLKHSSVKEVTCELKNSKTVQIFIQTLIKFPDSLANLQNLPPQSMMDHLQSVISTSDLPTQKILTLYWLNVAKCNQSEPQSALLILMDSALYTLTSESGLLVLFHLLPLCQLKDIQIGLAGQSLRLISATEESILAVYTYSQKHTQLLCRAILDIICPGDSRVPQHPLLHGNLIEMSLGWQVSVPELLLDAGLRVCCQFQKSLADLIYLLHCNMNHETVTLGEVQLKLYTSVAVHISPRTHSKHVVQFLLTDTHLCLVREDAVCHPLSHSVTTAPCRPHFHDLTLRRCSDVRCILVHDEDENRPVRLDVIFAKAQGRGHPESVTKAATPSAHALNSSPRAEVWKLTFSCSAEAACLINHLSNV